MVESKIRCMNFIDILSLVHVASEYERGETLQQIFNTEHQSPCATLAFNRNICLPLKQICSGIKGIP